jgi:hypothetical protein
LKKGPGLSISAARTFERGFVVRAREASVSWLLQQRELTNGYSDLRRLEGEISEK